jgi:kinesin family member 2/24
MNTLSRGMQLRA